MSMTLPASLDPEAVRLCALAVRYALSGPRFDDHTAAERSAIVEHGVEKMMAAGAFVRDGALFFPSNIGRLD